MTKKKQILIATGGVVFVLLVLGGIKGTQIRAMIKAGESWSPPPEAVTTADVVTADWQASFSAVGSVTAVRGVQIAAEVPGIVQTIAFESGQQVKKGDLLVRLDTAAEEAELAAAQADYQLAQAELTRTRKLNEAKVRTASELDTSEATAARAAAVAKTVRVAISKKTIRAPFAGRLGIRQVDVGEYLQPGTPIVTLEVPDPIYVDFRLPQQALARIAPGHAVEVSSDTFGDTHWTGKVETIDARVDPSTRNVLVRALVDNPDGELRTGMFVELKVLEPVVNRVLAIPESAVLYAPYGDSVFVVTETQDEKTGETQLVAKQVFVRLGERRGDLVAVLSGLEAGQRVVSTGAFKLRNNVQVVLRNDLAPDVSVDPNPDNK